MSLDDRGSKLQRFIYDLACIAFKPYSIIHEYPIGDLNQRIDIFIPKLGIAIEVNGEQHYKYNSFFYKDELAWNNAMRLDNDKHKYLEEHGVKVVYIPFDTKIKTADQLKQLVDSINYPETEYLGIEEKSAFQKLKDQQLKETRQKYKERLKNKKC